MNTTLMNEQKLENAFYTSLVGTEFTTNIDYDFWVIIEEPKNVEVLEYWKSKGLLKINYDGLHFYIEKELIFNLLLNDLNVEGEI